MKKAFVLLTIIMLTAMSDTINAQQQKPCTAPECSQFDFWLGDWRLTYNDTSHATNTITKEMNGCVIHEHFNDEVKLYHGESWSVYNPKTKLWQQTWVDDQGEYIVLTGTYSDGKMTLTTEPAMNNGVKIINRMVFHNITKDSFDWEWEATIDEGKTWKNNWHIHYQRK